MTYTLGFEPMTIYQQNHLAQCVFILSFFKLFKLSNLNNGIDFSIPFNDQHEIVCVSRWISQKPTNFLHSVGVSMTKIVISCISNKSFSTFAESLHTIVFNSWITNDTWTASTGMKHLIPFRDNGCT